jgi:glyoxylase-like metal-dependent hydrolase (beta-lactamase superfamily II)
METVAAGLGLVDVNFQGHPRVIGACVIETDAGLAIVDPGPTSTLPTLQKKLRAAGADVQEVRMLLLTHIHLDHAGASGTLVHQNPRIQVYVHERGAPHMVDPAKLLNSATRLYGSDMDRLWGRFDPVPKDNVNVLVGSERLDFGNVRVDVAYTPGHASHHVSYFDPSSGVAFVGDTMGMRIANAPFIYPPTPPPDIDIDLWTESIERIMTWKPERLFITHFGLSDGLEDHVSEFHARLTAWSERVRASLKEDGDDDTKAATFARDVDAELRRVVADEVAAQYTLGGPPEQCWMGLARYWRKRSASS